MSRELLALLNDTLRDPIGAPVLVAVLVLFLMGVANLAGWFFDEACGWYDRYSRWREMRQAARYHADAARQAEQFNRVVRLSDRTGAFIHGRRS